MNKKKPRPTLLECEHTVWYREGHDPAPGEELFCTQCNAISRVPQLDNEKATYYPDCEWNAYRLGPRRIRGECARQPEACDYKAAGDFVQVRNKMERHFRLGCDDANNWEFRLVALNSLPKNSPPPF